LLRGRDLEDLDEKITRALQGVATEEELQAIHRWRAEAPANEERYQRFAEVWRLVAPYGEGFQDSRPPDPATVVFAARRRGRGPHFWNRPSVRAAAVIAMLGGGYLLTQWGTDAVQGPLAAAEIVTGWGESSTTRLDDGTVIRLAPESRLLVHPGGSPREVVLEGRAFFAVAPDSTRTFRVRMAAGEVNVLGTRFEVTTRANDFRLVVVDGRVGVEAPGGAAEVGRNEVSHVRNGGAPSVVRVDDVWELVDWMGGFLAFESTSLRDVGRELERRFGTTLEFEDPQLAEETVTVWFGDEAADEVIAVLCRLVAATCSVEKSVVRVSRRP
jgi:transmembrane sensor